MWFLHQLPLQVLLFTTIRDAGKRLLIGGPTMLIATVGMMEETWVRRPKYKRHANRLFHQRVQHGDDPPPNESDRNPHEWMLETWRETVMFSLCTLG
jgi:hypothetical protein